MSVEQTKNLELITHNVGKTFAKFTLPNVLGFIAMSSCSIVDGVFIGKYVGGVALSAINIVIPIITLVFGFAIMLSIGGGVRVGKYLGEGKMAKASATFTNVEATIAFISIFMSIVCIFWSEMVVRILGANNEIAPYAISYMRIISFFFLAQAFEYSLSVFVRLDGNPYLASIAVIIGALLNVLFDYIFIIKLKLGISGAALGTGFACSIPVVILCFHFILKKGHLRLNFQKYDFREIRSSAYNGSSELLSEVSSGFLAFLLNWVMITSLGTQGVTAFTIINYVIWGINMLCYSIGDSLVPLMSVNYGAKEFKRIKSFMKIALICVIGGGLLVFIMLSLIPGKLVGFFISQNTEADQEAYNIAVIFASYIKWAFLFSGSSIIFSAYFTAMHKPLQSVIIAGARGLVLPVIFLGVMPLLIGSYGIYTAVPIAEILTVILALFLYLKSKQTVKTK